jgi:hypothetical protein
MAQQDLQTLPGARRRCWLAGAVLAVAGCVAAVPLAHAQAFFDGPAYAFPVTNMVGPAIVGSSMGAYLERGRSRDRNARRRETTPGNPYPLQVEQDARVSAQVKDDFRRALVSAHPTRQADIDKALRRDWVRGYADEIARPNGLDPRNLADAVTAYAVAGWAIVHQQAQISPRAVRAVRDQLRERLAFDPELARLPAAERQRMAESLMHHTVLIMAQRTEAHRTRNSALAQASAAHYRSTLREGLQVDMAQLDLTDQGFAPR